MDGFEGWRGDDWGMPNVSSAQDWDDGPTGARRPVSQVVGQHSHVLGQAVGDGN